MLREREGGIEGAVLGGGGGVVGGMGWDGVGWDGKGQGGWR